MPIKTIQVSMVQTITDACVSECGNYYLKVCHDNDGASFQYDCMMDNCGDLWHYVLHGGTDNWKTLHDNSKYIDADPNTGSYYRTHLTKYITPIAELSTGEYASWECLTNFLDKLDIPYKYYNGGSRDDDYLFIGYHKDDLPSHYGSDDVEKYKSTLKSWYNTWEGLATGNYTCYWFSIERVDNESDENCDSCGGFLLDDNLPYGEDVKDVMNSMREHFPSGVVFDDKSFEHAIDNAEY
jgi:hypothetical protein